MVDLRPNLAGLLQSPTSIPVLHGHDLAGKPCTLFDAIPTNTEGNLFGGHVREVLLSNRLVYGAHLDSIDDLQVAHATVDVWGLRQWANEYWESVESGKGAEVPKYSWLARVFRAAWPFRRGIDQTGELPDGEVLNVPLEGGVDLIIQRGTATREGRLAQRKSEAHVNAQFRLREPVSYQEFNERFVRPLQDLLVLVTRQEVEVDAVTVLVPYEDEKWWGDRKPIRGLTDIAVVERTSIDRPALRDTAFRRIPMPLRAWGSAAPTLVGRWFSLRQELRGPGNLLFATLNKKSASLENDALNLLSVAEGYHRGKYDEPPFSEEVHAEVLAMVGTIVDKGQRDHYLGRLKHANQQSQKQRVRALYERAEEAIPQARSWYRKQLQPLINTRNFLTHWGEPTGEVLEDWDLWAALNRVRIVLEVNLYLDLGLDAETIGRAIQIAYHERDFLNAA